MVRIKLQVTEGGEVRNVVRKWNVSSISTEDEECLLLDDLGKHLSVLLQLVPSGLQPGITVKRFHLIG